MANFPPVAVLKVTPSELTLPDNRVTLDGSGSWDPNPKGVIVSYKFLVDGVIILDSVSKTITATVLTSGTHEGKLIVTDKGGLTGVAIVPFNVKPAVIIPPSGKTIYGCNNQGKSIEDEIAINKSLGDLKAARIKENVKGYSKISKSVKLLYDAGMTIFINLGWDTSGTKFVSQSEMPSYRAALEKICKDLAPYKDKIVLVCENEPTNEGENYFQDIIENWIAQYRVFVEVANANGFKTADGAMHVPYIKTLVQGGRIVDNVLKVEKMLKAIKDIPCTYVNIHFNNNGKVAFNPADIKLAADYIRQVTGKQVISNEWHCEDIKAGTELTGMVKGCADAGLIYSIFFSGKQPDVESKADSLTDQGTTKLNALGIEYRNAIAALQ